MTNDSTVPAAPGAGYVEAEQVTLARFNPADVTADVNIRKDAAATVDDGFVAKIKATGGNRVPAVVMTTPGGGYRLRYGFRRYVACERAGVRLYAMIAGAEGDSQAERRARVLDQLAENDGRVPLTRSEECAALLTLFDGENMTAAGIAKATGRPKKTIEAALTVARSDLASQAADTHPGWTLEMSAALTEFEDDPDPGALARLDATGDEDPGRFGHVVAELRATREDRAAKAKVTAPLTADGYAVVENLPPAWKLLENLSHGGLPMSAGGVPEGTASHADCPGRAIWVTCDWAPPAGAGDDEGYDENNPERMTEEALREAGYVQEWRVRAHLCTNPDRHGHEWVRPGTAALPSTAGEAAEAAEREKEKNRRVRARNKLWYAATEEREKHLRSLLRRKEITPRAAADEAARFVLDNTVGGQESADLKHAIERGHELAAALLGLDVQPAENARAALRTVAQVATPKRRLVIHLALVLAAYEKFCRDPHTWQNAEQRVRYGVSLGAAAYLGWLEAETGYRLSVIEEEVVRRPVPEPPVPAGPPADIAPARAEVDTGRGLRVDAEPGDRGCSDPPGVSCSDAGCPVHGDEAEEERRALDEQDEEMMGPDEAEFNTSAATGNAWDEAAREEAERRPF